MKWPSKLDRVLFAPSSRSIYLAIFRVFVAVHILKKLFFAWPNAELLFSLDSFVAHYQDVSYLGIQIDFVREHVAWFFAIYGLLCVLMAFGIGKHITIFLVAFCTDIYQALNGYLLDGGDNLLKFAVFYLAMSNCYSWLSITQWKPRTATGRLLDNFFTRVSVFCLIVHICLVYMVAGLSKAHADVWYNGVAIYYIYMNERFMGTPWNPILGKNFLFTTIGSYFTIIWETCFAFGALNKRIRIPYLLMGVMMHVGIYVFMMIHEFQWFFVAHYGFFFSDKELRSAWNSFLSRVSKFGFGRVHGKSTADLGV